MASIGVFVGVAVGVLVDVAIGVLLGVAVGVEGLVGASIVIATIVVGGNGVGVCAGSGVLVCVVRNATV